MFLPHSSRTRILPIGLKFYLPSGAPDDYSMQRVGRHNQFLDRSDYGQKVDRLHVCVGCLTVGE